MFQWLKNHFIPHPGNDHQPYFLRLRTAALLLLLVLVLEGVYLASMFFILPRSQNFAAIFATVLVDETNQKRGTEKLSTLTVNPVLVAAAQMKANDMAEKGYFSHNTPDGKTPWYWFEKAGYDYAAAGENLAVNFVDSSDVTDAWMRSPSHRANIMSGNYNEIGIATAQGLYKGKSAIFVVELFGRPSLVSQLATYGTGVAQVGASPAPAPVAPVTLPPQRIASTGRIATSVPQALGESITPAETSKGAENSISVTPETVAATTAAPVAGEATNKLAVPDTTALSPGIAAHQPTRIEKLMASPRTFITFILLLIAGLVTIALGLAIFIKIRVQYPHLIVNGILLLAVALSFIIFNAALNLTRGII